MEYALFRKGPVASNIVEGGAFWYADKYARRLPDLQFHFLVGAGVEEGVPKIASGSGVTLNSYSCVRELAAPSACEARTRRTCRSSIPTISMIRTTSACRSKASS